MWLVVPLWPIEYVCQSELFIDLDIESNVLLMNIMDSQEVGLFISGWRKQKANAATVTLFTLAQEYEKYKMHVLK